MQHEREVVYLEGGNVSFKTWLDNLDNSIRPAIFRRVLRLRLGHYGDWRSVGSGVFELRVHCGPGYRVYYALYKHSTVVLLMGGNKKTQRRDIREAQKLWKEYRDEIKKVARRFT